MAVALIAAAIAVAGLTVALVLVRRQAVVAQRHVARLERTTGDTRARAAEQEAIAHQLAVGLDAIHQGVVLCDAAGNVVVRNRVAAEVEGGRHGDALLAKTTEDLLETALTGRAGRRSLELFGPPRRTVVITAEPLAARDRINGALAVIEDITERRRVDTVRRDFVANISHELKTPVGALALLAETLAAEDDPEVSRRLTARMLHESERVARIIDDLLELSRIEADETPVREPVPVHLLVAEAVGRVRSAADARDIAIHVDEPSHRLSVVGERRQLVSALANLLDNAVKYSDGGSVVEVRTGTDGSLVELQVVDHGAGIPARDLERVFERFYRVDRARSRETGGTGLGLAIVRHVMNNHDGEVAVVSHEGEGSTFTLRLPAGPGPVAVRRPDVAEAG
ncbi:MAG: two-component sensor histidine kinase [Acidimicrobiales bacterium]|nr:two-component sensor histidine kinase [Acidimicrobiales bacterium]